MTDVRGIICDFLKANGYDGLVDVEAECGCGIDDIGECCSPMVNCLPAYRWSAADCARCEVLAGVESFCDWEGHDCYRTKPAPAEEVPS